MTANQSSVPVIDTACCIVGGGPAGMMLGFLLGRAGIDTVVLEKHADFLRDFRGDTVHPWTLELIYELGLLDELLKLPHTKVRTAIAVVGGESVPLIDFTHLPTHCRYIALMPQWDFLDFLAQHGGRYPNLELMMRHEAIDFIEADGRIAGVKAMTPDGEVEIHARLTVGADGRHSTLRARSGFEVHDLGSPMDVLWMRISKQPEDAAAALGRVGGGHILVMLDRGDYWQCAFVIPKGGFEAIKSAGLPEPRRQLVLLAPALQGRVDELKTWDDVKLLTVAVDRLPTWYRPGLLMIGDAAHAMSPIGGVGINLAVQDAAAAANILAEPLRSDTLDIHHLAAVQKRREFPARVVQRAQVIIQNKVINRVLANHAEFSPPWPLRLLARMPWLRRVPARMIGKGIRPEHVLTAEHLAAAEEVPCADLETW